MVYKDEDRNTWYVRFWSKDSFGKRKEIWKRGFKTKKEASAWEAERRLVLSGSTGMRFSDFVNEIYLPYQEQRLKHLSFFTYSEILKRDILPYFGDFKLEDITAAQVTEWQNLQRKATGVRFNRPKSLRYLRDAHKMLSMVFKHAMRYYGLQRNPAAIAGNFQGVEQRNVDFWTFEEFQTVYKEMEKEPHYALAFSILYWTGLRQGELYALTKGDLDFEKNLLTVSKTGYFHHGEDYITTPKTEKSNRIISMPPFLAKQIKDYLDTIPGLKDSDRILPIKANSMRKALDRFARAAGVKEIRVHDLRRSHVSLLVDQGFSLVAIAKRLGHNSAAITSIYADLFPHVQEDISNSLESLHEEIAEDENP